MKTKNNLRVFLATAIAMAMILSCAGIFQIVGFFRNVDLAFANGGDPFENTRPFRHMDGRQLLDEMGMGWNLGNAFEANADQMPNETAWGSPVITRGMIQRAKDLGFNSIRIPITWGRMIIDDDNTGEVTINPIWIDRVQDVVDYAISAGLYVNINMHHDGAENGGWFALHEPNPAVGLTATWEERLARFEGAWTYIATRFRNYCERLIFTGINELRGGTNWTNPFPGNTSARQAFEDQRVSETNQTF
ncbi:MAG: glycoside hydrolase family 5 protein, partial [Firmicutes bacterium]|nr:glycoside hydrolase family 5 protein [Bacillota bacterium]